MIWRFATLENDTASYLNKYCTELYFRLTCLRNNPSFRKLLGQILNSQYSYLDCVEFIRDIKLPIDIEILQGNIFIDYIVYI